MVIPQCGRRDCVVVPNRLRRKTVSLHLVVEVIEMLRCELGEPKVAERGTDGPLNLRSIGPQRRRREIEANALFEPRIYQIAERRSNPVNRERDVRVEQSTKHSRCQHGARELPLDRIAAQVDPHLP